MKKLGISRYLADLHKDENGGLIQNTETEDDLGLQDLRVVSGKLFRET